MRQLSVKVLGHPGRGHSGRWIVATGLFLEDASPLAQEPSGYDSPAGTLQEELLSILADCPLLFPCSSQAL